MIVGCRKVNPLKQFVLKPLPQIWRNLIPRVRLLISGYRYLLRIRCMEYPYISSLRGKILRKDGSVPSTLYTPPYNPHTEINQLPANLHSPKRSHVPFHNIRAEVVVEGTISWRNRKFSALLQYSTSADSPPFTESNSY